MLCLRKEFSQLNGLNLLYSLCLRNAMLIIRIITEVSRYVSDASSKVYTTIINLRLQEYYRHNLYTYRHE